MKVEMKEQKWLGMWAAAAGVESPSVRAQRVEAGESGVSVGDPYALAVAFIDGGEERNAELYPQEVAEVVGQGVYRGVRGARFDGRNTLTFEARWR